MAKIEQSRRVDTQVPKIELGTSFSNAMLLFLDSLQHPTAPIKDEVAKRHILKINIPGAIGNITSRVGMDMPVKNPIHSAQGPLIVRAIPSVPFPIFGDEGTIAVSARFPVAYIAGNGKLVNFFGPKIAITLPQDQRIEIIKSSDGEFVTQDDNKPLLTDQLLKLDLVLGELTSACARFELARHGIYPHTRQEQTITPNSDLL